MKNFFWRSFAASALATFIIGFALIFVFIAAVAGLLSTQLSGLSIFENKPLEVKENSILHLDLRGELSDRSSVMLLQNEVFPMGSPGLYDMTQAIKYAAIDPNIEGILLEVDVISGGLANMKDLRDEIIAFKSSGKFVIAFSNAYTQSAYYLASAADSLYLYPMGYLQLNGLVARVMFIKDMLAKLEIEPQIIRGSNNKFKSAVEPLIANEMSSENREQNARMINGMWSVVSEEIAASRRMSVSELNSIIDSIPYMTGKEAYDVGLADGNLTREQLEKSLSKRTKISDKPRLVSFYRYTNWVREREQLTWDMLPNIAVIYAQGEIDMDEGGKSSIGTKNLPEAIRAARMDPFIKAVVIRVNSPGGAVLTSDIIYQELIALLEEKPVVVSMGNVAASGGYYISLPSTRIFASPLTITGSIGVFGVWPNLQGLMNNKLGIQYDHVSTNKQGDFGNVNRPMHEHEYRRIQHEIDEVYEEFTTIVSKWRPGLASPADVDSIGQGRVWNGIDAKEIGLIDEFGSIYDAINFAAKEAGLEKVCIREYPRYKLEGLDALFAMFDNLGGNDAILNANITHNIQGEIGQELLDGFRYLLSIDKMKGVQARMMYNFWFD
jgi:protease IV